MHKSSVINTMCRLETKNQIGSNEQQEYLSAPLPHFMDETWKKCVTEHNLSTNQIVAKKSWN